MLLDEVGVLAQCGVHVAEQDPLGLQVLTVLVIDDLGLVLGGDTCEVPAPGLRDAELLVRAHHLVGELVPLVDLLTRGAQVVVDVLEVDVGHVHRKPLGHRRALEQLQAAPAHLVHPARLSPALRHLIDDARIDALLVDVHSGQGSHRRSPRAPDRSEPGRGDARRTMILRASPG